MRTLVGLLAQTETPDKSVWDNLVLDEFRIPFGEWIDQSVDWIDNKLQTLLDIVNWPFETLIDLIVNNFLIEISWVWVVFGMGLIATLVRNIKVGAGVALALTVCGILGNAYWVETARTIGFIGVAVILCVIIGLPIGIAAGRIDGLWQVTRPILDAMQVVHSFVYMLPFIFFWGIGEVSATMVTMVFAIPPLIRLTNLGIRQVPSDVVEAARAFGAPERRVLFDVQLPLARPAIMTGINQTLLLAISMLGIAAIMGAGGLGRLLFRSLSNQDVALAASAGLAFFLVAVVLDRMSQRDDADTANLFTRIRRAWAHRRDPEELLGDEEGDAITRHVAVDRYQPVKDNERVPMLTALVGGLIGVISVFLTWTTDAGKISAFGNRSNEDLPGTYNGLDAVGGSWFGYVVLGAGLFVVASVVMSYLRPGRGPRWLTADGALIAGLTGLIAVGGFMLASPPDLAVDPGTGLGVLLAVVGSAIAAAGALLWVRVAPHTPLHPLKATVSRGKIIGVGIALVVLLGGAFGGWYFDARTDIIITPEVQAQIDDLQAQAEADPAQAAVIANQISALVSAAQATQTVIVDGVADEGPGLGLWALLLGIVGTAAGVVAAGVFGVEERKLWIWNSVTAGIGAGIAAIAFGWIFTLVRNADPNFVSGVGSFLTLLGGFFILASTMSVLGEFRRSKVYDDDLSEAGVEEAAAERAAELV